MIYQSPMVFGINIVSFIFLFLMIVFLVVEFITPSNLILIWFVPGLLIATILAAYHVNLSLILFIVIISYILLMLIVRPKIMKNIRQKKSISSTHTNLLIGKTFVSQGLISQDPSREQIGDVHYTVITRDQHPIEPKSIVTIKGTEGIVLICTVEEEKEEA